MLFSVSTSLIAVADHVLFLSILMIHTNHLKTISSSAAAMVKVVCDVDVTALKTIPTFTGGQTMFPEFHTSITPTKGSALFFFNVLERPGSRNYNINMFLNVDKKLRHAGLPVLTGEKWIANRWIHPRNFGAGVRGLG